MFKVKRGNCHCISEHKEVNVEGIGLSSHVVLDQVWVNSVIRITQCMKLCRGVQSDPPAGGLTKSIVIHQWNNMLCSPEDITIGMHGQHCELIQSWMSIKASSACNNCSHYVGSLLIRKHDQEQLGKYIAEGNIILEGNTKDKRKGKKRRKKGSVNKMQNDCDCMKSKKLRLSPNCHHVPRVSERRKTGKSVVHPVTLIKNQSHSIEMREESKHLSQEYYITDGMSTIKNEDTDVSMLQESNEIDILPSTTMVKNEEPLMSESNIINVVPTAIRGN